MDTLGYRFSIFLKRFIAIFFIIIFLAILIILLIFCLIFLFFNFNLLYLLLFDLLFLGCCDFFIATSLFGCFSVLMVIIVRRYVFFLHSYIIGIVYIIFFCELTSRCFQILLYLKYSLLFLSNYTFRCAS